MVGVVLAQSHHPGAHQPLLRIHRLCDRVVRALHDTTIRVADGLACGTRGDAGPLHLVRVPLLLGADRYRSTPSAVAVLGPLDPAVVGTGCSRFLRRRHDDGHHPMAVEWYGIVRPEW